MSCKRVGLVFLSLVLTVSVLISGFSGIYAYEAEDKVYGDVNGDWQVTSTDYLLIKKIFGGQQATAKVKDRADINCDGKITSTDYLTLKRIFSGQPVTEYQKELKPQPAVNDPGNYVSYAVSGVFTSDMVLQRDQIINVWGWSSNVGSYIYGEFMGEKRYAQVDSNGEWMLQFSPKRYTSKGQTLTIGPKNGRQSVFTNVLVGDVWIVSGQSNAEYSFREMATYYTELYDIIDENDNIRLYREDKNDVWWEEGILQDVVMPYQWTKTTETTVNAFSALGYMFVKELADNTNIPQGIIMATAGGCKLEDFMDPDTAKKVTQHGTFWPEPQAIYKRMLAPFLHMTFTGMLFYQGESDNLWASEYPDALAKCVAGWRDQFDSDFAFYNVQCTSHGALASNPKEWAGLPQLRAAQLDAYYKIPNSYLISTIDVGYRLRPWNEPEEDYAHTFNKWTIGQRAAHIALARYYEDSNYRYEYVSCPIPEKVTWYDDYVLIDFKNVGDGLKAYDGKLTGFKISLPGNKSLENADASIVDKDTVRINLRDTTGRISSVCAYAIEHSALLEEANLVNSNNVPCPTFYFNKK